jgi:hypothetical protein
MRFLSVAERELRAAARRAGTYRLRWFTALGFFGLLLWLGWATGAFRSRSGGRDLFEAFSVITFLYCLAIGATATADCVSRERREGTLGLLFLTNLNGLEIIAGKLCSSLLGAVYPLLALLPILALPVLLGGVMLGELGRMMLALISGTCFGVVVGMLASAVTVRQFPAVALAMGLALVGGLGAAGVAGVLEAFRFPKFLVGLVGVFSPLTSLISALSNARSPSWTYWLSLVVVAIECLLCLSFVVWWVSRSWMDRPKRSFFRRKVTVPPVINPRSSASPSSRQASRTPRQAARAAQRRRFLDTNPILWLSDRSRFGVPVFAIVAVVVFVVVVGVLAPLFAVSLPVGAMSPIIGLMIAWIIATLTLHVLALYYAAMVAAQRLAEDRQSGSLELILCTPTTEATISRGLWRAFFRKLTFPALLLALAHVVLLWLIGLVTIMDSPGSYPGLTPFGLLWKAVLGSAIPGSTPSWVLQFLVRLVVLVWVVLVGAWITLGWVARWLGLRMKQPGFAPLAALALVIVPPVVVFSLTCFVFDEWRITRMPEKRLMPLMLWIAVGQCAEHLVLLAVWAAGRLKRDLRAIATGSYERPRLWWLPRPRTLLRFACAGAVVPLLIVLAAAGYFGLQNWRSRHDWKVFQAELRQQGRSLEVATLLPPPVPDAQNFARSPTFLALLHAKTNNTQASRLLAQTFAFSRVELPPVQANRDLMPWMEQRPLDLAAVLRWLSVRRPAAASTNRSDCAPEVRAGLAPLDDTLRALAAATIQRPRFQSATNRGPAAVLLGQQSEAWALAHAHFLFEVRSSARLASGDFPGAADDILASLRVVELARQDPAVQAAPFAQTLLARSVQPLWEGIVEHRWSEVQLAEFQAALGRFDLIADYTNAVRRAVLAHIKNWQAVPESGQARISIPQSGGYVRRDEWDWLPRGWWFDDCIQLYRATDRLLSGVDIARGRIALTHYYSDFEGLPLDQPTQLLLQPNWWSPGPAQIARAQAALDQTILACALERYRLAQGSYPGALQDLVPRYLARVPPDYGLGRPMIYARESADRFTLLAVGPNGQNDRGKPVSDDWLWGFQRLQPLRTNAPTSQSPGRR